MPPRANELEKQPGLLGRLRLTAERWVQQLLAPIDIPVWGGGGGGTVVSPGYPHLRSMSALAAFPWVRACVRAKVDDVGGLPLIAVRGRGLTEQLLDHPFLALMRNPSPGVTETVLRRQLEADLVLTGNAFLWLRRTALGFELHRLHPSHMKPVVSRGLLVGWRYADEKPLSTLEVYHVRDVSWSDDLTMIFGESAIRTLHEGLVGVQAARRHTARQADRGRPDVIIGVDTAAGGQQAIDKIGESYEENARKGRRAFVVAKGVEANPVTWKPADLEFTELDDRTRDETLAVMRVPPTRAGVAQANYAVAKAELRDYWSSLVVSDLKLLEDAFTAIAHVVGGSLDSVIRHDVSGVEALQTSYDQRQARAGFWVTVMGATPEEAAAYEGFRDAPVGKVAGTQPASRPAKEVDDQPARQAAQLERMLAAWLRLAAERLQGGGAGVEAEALRLAGVLELGGVPSGEALEIGREVASIVCGVADSTDRDLGELYPFSPAYARQVATRPRLALAAK
jgi:phage portal protein BeeE